MTDFWLSCGHHLTDRDISGGVLISDDFLKAYLARPELKPPAEACAAERRLHAALLAARAARSMAWRLPQSPMRMHKKTGS
jgi:hypothetical protein